MPLNGRRFAREHIYSKNRYDRTKAILDERDGPKEDEEGEEGEGLIRQSGI